ncbi:MAG: signal recognition particle-docking protein FtsY [Hyphomicrobiaceae bacterium]|nr:MAG: signal recognition particle-docking protein FtsY [Hyphomicrobiaceae bacterium]
MTSEKKGRGIFGRLFGAHDGAVAERPAAPPAGEAENAAAARGEEPKENAPAAMRPPEAEPAKGGWLARLKTGLTRSSSKLGSGIAGLFTKRKLDASTLEDLEDLLIEADLGVETADRIVAALRSGRHEKGISPEEVRQILAAEIEGVLQPVARPLPACEGRKPHVILVVGVNGTGKTTTIGKLAHRYRQQGKSVMLAAGDTFRAAAIDQLKIWGTRSGSAVVAREVGADAAGLAFDALSAAREQGIDVVLIDTAGRLQNKAGLMAELEKVSRVIKKIDPSAPHDVLLVLDATTGQNALNQVEVFRDKIGVTGLVMTKLDGTARGGILVAIAARFGLPVQAIGVGEDVDDLQPFDAGEFARAIALG